MNIILSEEGPGGEQTAERSFSKSVIVVGRDAFECDIAFDNERFPMVSRKHAELRWNDNKWFVADLNSSYGTYINGHPVASIAPLAAGAAIQLGMDGPILRVVWFEQANEAGIGIQSITPPSVAPQVPSQNVIATPGNISEASLPIIQPADAILEFLNASKPSFQISKSEIWFGREADCDIVFDASSGTVSRRHAVVRLQDESYVLADNNSFNGTFLNEHRITASVPLANNDEIRLGKGGPVVRFVLAGRESSIKDAKPAVNTSHSEGPAPQTIVLKLEKRITDKVVGGGDSELISTAGFAGKSELIIGRDESCDIRLDGLQTSKRHARMLASGSDFTIEDLNSTNGVFVNGERISRKVVKFGDSVQIGSFLLRIDDAGNIGVFDSRSKTRIDAVSLTQEVKNPAGSRLKLLDTISLSIQPNQFVGILGPSGSGKSTLVEAMNGVRPPTAGHVLVNNRDLYRNFDLLKQQIGFVPQEDIIHRELTVYRTLYYVARLRLSRDVSSAEIDQIIDEVLDVTDLAERKNVPVHRLSGGQRKRVSIAVELITKPSVIFLDEPTSGLDPSAEEKIMRLFREIAESGRTVVMTTHAMENVQLFDKIIILMTGRLVFYGTPQEALKHFAVESFKELYLQLERPSSKNTLNDSAADVSQAADRLKDKFQLTPQYARNVGDPLKQLGSLQQTKLQKKRRLGIFGAFGQWITLSRRYFAVLLRDKFNLFILFAQAPLIALLTYFAVGKFQPRDFIYFVVALVAFWFGISVSAREIIREKAVYRRERMFNLGVIPYLFSKLLVLGMIVTMQCLMLFGPLKILDLAGMLSMPGEMLGVPQLWAMLLTAGVGIACGLLISALVRTSEMATSLVPMILIPQILFSGLVGVPHGVNKVIGLTMPSAWSFDTIKRFSTLDTLESEGANPKGKTKGLGLYRSLEVENEKAIADAKSDLEELKKAGGGAFQDGEIPSAGLPEIPTLKKVPTDLSGYVSFLHPWMNEVLNQVILMLMFGVLVFAALVVLRLKD